ncbi:WD40/YVTN/BNR-like repeat-containing protein [Streptomyces flavofungini]|uniref:Exo-alpha-sialidase n=1 Tax=Streptomyces flavofungini TaxID=68200 RepID=A0ABS0XHR3_9ACTN|nr:hypothetical protein [Streptomyces flavofungini]MBJ3812763.1 hypothetical protein [Streptomyces flavofungini]GHC67279.1 hypothetical protein GCM10010349_40080 [Streptomyces flavofungini]
MFRNSVPNAFYDCVAFFDDRHGLAVSDPVGGKFPEGGGSTWRPAPADGMPAATPDDGALATGTCMIAHDRRHAWFGTTGTRGGAGHNPQVFHTADGGRTWSAADTPIPGGFRNSVAWVPGGGHTAVAVGPNGSDVSTDGGRSWTRFDRARLLGVNCLPGAGCWAVGEHGTAARLVIRHP